MVRLKVQKVAHVLGRSAELILRHVEGKVEKFESDYGQTSNEAARLSICGQKEEKSKNSKKIEKCKKSRSEPAVVRLATGRPDTSRKVEKRLNCFFSIISKNEKSGHFELNSGPTYD